MIIDYDLAIVGAGPSGSGCALALHGKGLKVVLIDKDNYPRDKICGDAIPGQSFKAIDSINKNWGNQMRGYIEKMEITTSTAYLPKKKKITYKWVNFSYNSKRIDFDNFLLDLVKKETNTTVLENKRVKKVTEEANYINCELQDGISFKVKMIVGCDGANSIVKKNLFTIHSDKKNSLAAIRAYYKGIDGIKEGENEFHYLKGLNSYFWIFPLKDGFANIGLGITKNKKKQHRAPSDTRKTLEEIINSPAFVTRFKNATRIGEVNGFGLPTWTKTMPISGNRFILCGDAASLIDPLFGHGIDKAIWSGSIAATQIFNCFKQNNFSAAFMNQYDQAINKKFRRELAKNNFILKILFRFPSVINLLTALAFNERFARWLIKKMKL